MTFVASGVVQQHPRFDFSFAACHPSLSLPMFCACLYDRLKNKGKIPKKKNNLTMMNQKIRKVCYADDQIYPQGYTEKTEHCG